MSTIDRARRVAAFLAYAGRSYTAAELAAELDEEIGPLEKAIEWLAERGLVLCMLRESDNGDHVRSVSSCVAGEFWLLDSFRISMELELGVARAKIERLKEELKRPTPRHRTRDARRALAKVRADLAAERKRAAELEAAIRSHRSPDRDLARYTLARVRISEAIDDIDIGEVNHVEGIEEWAETVVRAIRVLKAKGGAA